MYKEQSRRRYRERAQKAPSYPKRIVFPALICDRINFYFSRRHRFRTRPILISNVGRTLLIARALQRDLAGEKKHLFIVSRVIRCAARTSSSSIGSALTTHRYRDERPTCGSDNRLKNEHTSGGNAISEGETHFRSCFVAPLYGILRNRQLGSILSLFVSPSALDVSTFRNAQYKCWKLQFTGVSFEMAFFFFFPILSPFPFFARFNLPYIH